MLLVSVNHKTLSNEDISYTLTRCALPGNATTRSTEVAHNYCE